MWLLIKKIIEDEKKNTRYGKRIQIELAQSTFRIADHFLDNTPQAQYHSTINIGATFDITHQANSY